MPALHWLPDEPDWKAGLTAVRTWPQAVALANTRHDFVRANALDRTVRALVPQPPEHVPTVRLALLGSCTMAHLHGALRVAGLRRGLWFEMYEAAFGQHMQELVDPGSGLHVFGPTVVLLALDAHHLADDDVEALDRIATCWRLAREAFGCTVLHQTPLAVHPDLLGLNEHRLAASAAAVVARIGQALRPLADAAGVGLVSVDTRAARDGIDAWHDVGMWHRAKQEIALTAAPFYGDMVARLIAATLGRSAKCLVLDLDNTVWGGVIGDDGLAGIVLGQGSPLGEAFAAFQRYARDLSRRGVILAVCSKNDEARALEPFEAHPDMVLRRCDIASFVANWDDKASNLRRIAAELNIGLDSLVFVDDNPVERALVRRELPMVSVPELGDDPVGFVRMLSDAGYFESVSVTDEDRGRVRLYQQNRDRAEMQVAASDMQAYLRSLDMRLEWRRFDEVGVPRIVQLINKTNQFNLTARRYSQEEVEAVMRCDRGFGLQMRLIDRFGDNGVIAVVIGRLEGRDDVRIDTWLMSCRVLGRGVEGAMLNVVAAEARRLGAVRLLGDHVPTARNGMVREHYARLGFLPAVVMDDGCCRATLGLAGFTSVESCISVVEG